ncbi:MAG: peptidase, partial [Bacteroidales bacterium]|nr:peptidase [Bacteroidales bacterium]
MKRFALIFLMLLTAGGLAAQEQYGVVRLSVCNMRRTPDFDAEMVSQALLGTPVHILRINPEGNRWPEIQSPEGYTGWVHGAGIQILTKEEYSAWNAAEKVVVTALTGIVYEQPSAKSATLSDVVGGDRLRFLGTKGRFFR